MIASVDGRPMPPEALWWPAMNFGQFRWDGTVGHYKLDVPRAEFVERLGDAYARLVEELRFDDRLVPDQKPTPLRQAGYPPLDAVLDDAAARVELLDVFLWDDFLGEFVPYRRSRASRFMINSIEEVEASPTSVVVRGRGYHWGAGGG